MTKLHYGRPALPGVAACGKLMLETTAGPAVIKELRCVQAALALVSLQHEQDAGDAVAAPQATAPPSAPTLPSAVTMTVPYGKDAGLGAIAAVVGRVPRKEWARAMRLWYAHMQLCGRDSTRAILAGGGGAGAGAGVGDTTSGGGSGAATGSGETGAAISTGGSSDHDDIFESVIANNQNLSMRAREYQGMKRTRPNALGRTPMAPARRSSPSQPPFTRWLVVCPPACLPACFVLTWLQPQQ